MQCSVKHRNNRDLFSVRLACMCELTSSSCELAHRSSTVFIAGRSCSRGVTVRCASFECDGWESLDSRDEEDEYRIGFDAADLATAPLAAAAALAIAELAATAAAFDTTAAALPFTSAIV